MHWSHCHSGNLNLTPISPVPIAVVTGNHANNSSAKQSSSLPLLESPVVSRGSHLKQRLCLFKTALYKSTLMLYHNFLDGFDRASQLTTCAFLIKHCFPDCTTWSGSLFTLLFLQSLKKNLEDFFWGGEAFSFSHGNNNRHGNCLSFYLNSRWSLLSFGWISYIMHCFYLNVK